MSTTFLRDTFTGPAGTSLTAHTSEMATWTAPHGNMVLDGSGVASAPGDTEAGVAAAQVPANFDNVDLQAAFTRIGGGNAYPGIGFADAAGNELKVIYNGAAGVFSLQQGNTSLGSSAVMALANGVGRVVRLSARPGGAYSVSVDGAAVISATGVTFTAVKVILTGYGGSVGVADLTGTDLGGSNPAPPVAAFTAAPASGTAPLTVSFTNSSTGATSQGWTFGDGATSTAISPSHTFTAAGTYNVTLTASNANGMNSVSHPVSVVTAGTVVNFVTSGDSLTQGYDGVDQQGYPATGYPARVVAALGANWQLHNIAKGGEGTAYFLANDPPQLQSLYVAGQRNVFVLMAGTNDSAAYHRDFSGQSPTPAIQFQNIQNEVTQAQALGYEVFVGTLLDSTAGSGFNEADDDRRALNALIRGGFPADHVIDWGADSRLGTPHGVSNQDSPTTGYFLADHLHCNPRGYQVMADLAVPLLSAGASTPPTPPSITSAASASATVGVPFSYQITATQAPASYAATGLPAGLSVNTSTGAISGTPTTAGSATVTISATNAGGTGTASLALTVSGAPGGGGSVSRFIKIDGVFVIIDEHGGQVTPPTGNATAADVAAGKTFSSALVPTGATGTNTANATVTDGAPIQPPQAFVGFALATSFISIDSLSDAIQAQPSVTYFDGEFLRRLVQMFFQWQGQQVQINFSSKSLTPESVDSILAGLTSPDYGGLVYGNGFLYLYGPQMGSPTLSSPGVLADFTIQIVDPGTFSFDPNPGGDGTQEFYVSSDNTIGLAESFFTTGNPYIVVTIGVQDNPSAADCAAKVAELLDGLLTNGSLTAAGDTLHFVDTIARGWYLGNGLSGVVITPLVGDLNECGHAERPNADLQTLIDGGWQGDYKGPDGSQVTF